MPDWKQVELLVVKDTKSTNHEGSGWKIRVVQYILDGASKAIKLESGEYWVDKDSNEQRFKPKGFTKKDLEACKPHWKGIMNLMDNPPAPPINKDEKVEEKEPSMDDVPF